jgi:predicted DNA-binding antitoxin AbrB/MazE fold protein
MMIRAVVRNGVFVPLEPLPPECSEGRRVELSLVAAASERSDDEAWRDVEEAAAGISDEDYHRMMAVIEEADRPEKERMRREMGLS